MSNSPAAYSLLRHLTLPVVAVTTSANGRRNGFIVNSAQRASLVPNAARISLYVSKTNVSHDIVYASGVFGIHILRDDQYDVIEKLGLRSARDVPDKLAELRVRDGLTRCPMLEECVVAFECRVVNAMDAGGATFFLGDVIDMQQNAPDDTPIMTSTHFRRNAPADLKRAYEAGLEKAQQQLAPLSAHVSLKPWPGVTAQA
jgi:flavin reductase (DIM6/NTAB) family NADH-FMN oxidoreductase RutF